MSDTTTVTPAAPVAADFDFPSPGTSGYNEFRKTGKLPEVAESAPAEVTVPEVAPEAQETEPEVAEEAPDAEIAAAPAAAPPQKKKDAAARLREVLDERKKDRELIRQLTEKLTGAPSVQPASQTAAPTEAKPQTGTKPKIDDVDAQGKPVFKTYGEYEDARDEYNRAELMRLFEDKQTKAQKTQQEAEANKLIAQTFGAKVVEARKKYADFDAVAFDSKLPIKQGSVPDQFIVESAHGPEVLYFLGQNTEELDRILAMNPIAQARELFKIEQTFVPKPAAPKPPARTITQAPPPPHQVTGKGPSPDSLEKAVKDGDFNAYRDAENARILALRKAKGR
jgi:hypothetical protein